MIITKKRIRSLSANLPHIAQGTSLVFALKDLNDHRANLERAGFLLPLTTGVAITPSKRGPVSRFNAEGRDIVHRDQPMETVTYHRDWPHKEWRGRDEVEEVVTLTAFKYKRYPRTREKAPGVEFQISTTTDGEMILSTDQVVFSESTEKQCLHTINLILEHFGECHVLDGNLDSIIRVEVKRLNWEVLPPGVTPWAKLESLLKDRIARFESNKNAVFRNSLAYVNSFKPDFSAVGRAGFTGYVVFGFPAKNTYVCESIYTHNATYVFDSNWEKFSQMTKAEVLNHNFQKERIIHTDGWHSRIRKVLE